VISGTGTAFRLCSIAGFGNTGAHWWLSQLICMWLIQSGWIFPLNWCGLFWHLHDVGGASRNGITEYCGVFCVSQHLSSAPSYYRSDGLLPFCQFGRLVIYSPVLNTRSG
jgi:hypothetical protein